MAIQLKKIEEQIMVITGASSGIGLATAREAARRGARLVLAARSEKTLAQIAHEIKTNGGHAIVVPADVAKFVEVEQVARAAIAAFGRIDTWVNNAGVSIYGRIEETSEADARRLFDSNFWGVVNGSMAALPHLRKQGGALINVGSEVSEAAVPLQGFYTASKHAVKGFTDSLRIEVEEVDKAPVAITLIQPTAVDTPFPDHARNYLNHQPRLPDPMIEPQQVAEAILAAATSHTRATRVGANSKINTFVAKNFPGVAEHMAAKYVDKQQKAEAPVAPDGTLFRPGESGQTHGRSRSAPSL